MAEVACLVLGLASWLSGLVTQPRLVRCPSGWYAQGARWEGWTSCAHDRPDREERYPEEIILRVYCKADERAVVLADWHTVTCRRAEYL